MAHFMTVLGIVFLIAASTGSYGLAGAASGGYALAYSAVSPLTSRLVDRYRQGRVLLPATIANVLARAGFLAAAWLGAPGWSLVLLGALAGATMPAVGSLVRARWSHLYRASPLLHPALSFESVVDETILIVAPVAVATLAVYLNPSAGLVVALLLAAIGPAALAAQRDTEPPPAHATRSGGTPLSIPGFASLLGAFAAVAMATVTIEVATVAFGRQHHAPAVSGPVLAVLALSSAICGLWYGARERRRAPQRRLAWTLVLFAAATLGFVCASNVGTLFLAALVLGPTLAPTFINGFSVVHRVVPARQLTEGLTWLTTASGAGIALGSALAGRAIDAWGTRAAFGLATCCATLAIPIGLGTLLRLRPAAPDTAP
jgi:hypothetical protein